MLSSESVSGLSIQLIDKDEYNKEVAEKMSRVTVITGGTSGIGRGIVEKILANSEQDDLIFATYAHNAYKANDFWDSLKPEDQEKLIIMKADMSSYDDMMNFVKEVKEKAGHVDWLISNAGISTYDKFQDYTFEEWNNIVNTNLSIPVFMIKEFMPVMTEGGRVLFMGSYAGQQAYSSSLVYGVTKAAIHFLTKSGIYPDPVAREPHTGKLRTHQPQDRPPQIRRDQGCGGYGVQYSHEQLYEWKHRGYPWRI